MVHILRKPQPKIAEIDCRRIKFTPGDRILVRCWRRLTDDEIKRLRRTLNKWAGVEVEVLFYDGTEMEINVDQLPRSVEGR